tara:strand:- start:2151 stop:3209 length:1059 start_codon:yes stop_codon:yes gene_type:complete
MSTFTYNQFKNPTNQGIYYSDHFHNLNTGISHSHTGGNTQHVHNNYPNYYVTKSGCNSRCPGGSGGGGSSSRPTQRVYVKGNTTFPDNNKPIIRKHPVSADAIGGNDAYVSPSVITQPRTRDDAEKYHTSMPRIPITSGEQIARKKWANIYFDKVSGIDGILDVYSSSSERIDLRITQNSLSLTSATGDGTGIDLSSVSLNAIGEGVNSYLDYDQSGNIVEDVNGFRTMTILPLKEPGPPTSYNVVVNLNGGIGGTPVTENLLSKLNIKPPIQYHGKPTQRDHRSAALKGAGIKETYMADIVGDHFHYFPIRGNIINGYVANHSGQEHTGDIPKFPNKKIRTYYSKRKVFLM